MKLTVEELAGRLNAELVGDGSGLIERVQALEAADERSVTFVTDAKHASALDGSRAGAVIVGRRIEGFSRPQLVVANVNAALIEALKIFAPELKPASPGVDATARVSPTARIGQGVSIGPMVVVEDGAQIGAGTVVAAGCSIGRNTRIGADCRLDANVVVYHNCVIGNNVTIQANSTVGSTGFGYYFIDGAHRLIPHNGGVIIEDFVEIGANCCIDRAKFGNTVIGAGTKIDNLVQIAHNVVIGKCCLIAALTGISGSCRLGDGVVLAGQVGIKDGTKIGAGVMVGAQAGIMSDVEPGRRILGAPAVDYKEQLKMWAHWRRLPKMAEDLKRLLAKVQKLEASKDDKERNPD